MAKKAAAAKRFPKEHDDDGQSDTFAPPDRPDQVDIGSDSRPEEIDIFGASAAKDPDDARDAEEILDEDEDRAIAARDTRQRTDEGTALSSNHHEDGDDARVTRKARGRNGREDDTDYSKRVQRRVNREIALRKRSDARLAEERAARQQLEQRLAKVERAQVDEQGDASLKEIDAKLREIATKLAEAKEANDTKREVELQIELGELQGQKIVLQERLQAEKIVRARAADTDTSASRRADEEVRHEPKGRSSEWIRAQRRWWNTSRWASAHDDAIEHDKTILAEIEDGELECEPYSDEHLEELSRRLKADYPDLEVRTTDGERFEETDPDDRDGDDDETVGDDRRERMGNQRHDDDADDQRTARRPKAKSNRPPMGGLGGREGRRERSDVEMARKGKVTLSEQDFQTMRTFKLDPNNPEHKKYFAKERARTILRAANNGATRR